MVVCDARYHVSHFCVKSKVIVLFPGCGYCSQDLMMWRIDRWKRMCVYVVRYVRSPKHNALVPPKALTAQLSPSPADLGNNHFVSLFLFGNMSHTCPML
jgi:hypothetical protein